MERITNYPAAGHFSFGLVLCALEQYDRSIDHLERLVDARAGGSVFIGADNALAPLRGRPRYEALLRRIGGPQPQMA